MGVNENKNFQKQPKVFEREKQMFRNNHVRGVCTFKKSTVSNELAGFRTSGSAIFEAIPADGKKKKRRGNLWGADCVCRESFTHGAQ